MQSFHGSIRKKLALLIVLSALPAFVIIVIIGVQNRSKAVANAEQELLTFVDQAAENQERATAAIKSLLENMARLPEVRRGDAAACSQLFANMLSVNPLYGALHLVDLDGNLVASARPHTQANFAGVKHFRDALNTGRFAAGEYLVGVTLGVPVFGFGCPVLDEKGKVKAVLLTSIKLDSYGKLFEQTRFPADSFFGLCDQNGIRLFRVPERTATAPGIKIHPTIFAAAQANGMQGLTTDISSDGIERIVAYQQLRLTPNSPPYMYMFVGVPKALVAASARATLLRDLGVLLFMMLLTLTFGWYFGGRTIGERLEELAEVSARIGDGDFSARARLDPSITEVNALAMSFNAMAEAFSHDIAEREKAEAILSKEREFTNAVLDSVPGLLYLYDDQGLLVRWNKQHETITGFSAAELSRKHVLDWYEGDQPAQQRITKALERVMREGYAAEEAELRTKSGARLPFFLTAVPLYIDGRMYFVGVGIDMTARRLAERERQQLSQILENSDSIAVLKDSSLRYLMVNRAYLRLTGRESVRELIGKTDAQLFSGIATAEEIARYMENDRRAMALPAGQVLSAEESMSSGDGGERTFLTTKFPVYAEDGQTLLGVATLTNEISGRKRMELDLLTARDEAESANRAKSEFLANMSHEIRTPLNGIMGMIQLLQETALDEDQKLYAEHAMSASNRLTRLLSDILDISRVEAGKLHIAQEPFSLHETLQSTEQLFRPAFQQAGVALLMHVAPNVAPVLLGDSARLQQVLGNLIGNALKFTPSGSVTVEAYPLPPVKAGTQRVLFSVTDTGRGIADDMLKKLFEPFVQADEGFARKHQGAGLGLAISRKLVSLMGGNIAVASEEGAGTTIHFCCTFGLAEAEGPAQDCAQPTARPIPAMRILLADDEPIGQLSMKTMLTRMGHEVVTVGDGLEALAALRRGGFDCVLMDVQMPEMDGVEATRLLRCAPEFAAQAQIPVIALTAYALAGDREKFLAAGMNDHVAKPVQLEDLKRALERVAAALASKR